MINAIEARKVAENKNTLDYDTQLEAIFDLINQESKNGAFHIWIYKPLISGIRETLIEKGYTVGKTTDDRDGTNTQISW